MIQKKEMTHWMNIDKQLMRHACSLLSDYPDYPVAVESNENCSLGNEVYNIAPGENTHTVSIERHKMWRACISSVVPERAVWLHRW